MTTFELIVWFLLAVVVLYIVFRVVGQVLYLLGKSLITWFARRGLLMNGWTEIRFFKMEDMNFHRTYVKGVEEDGTVKFYTLQEACVKNHEDVTRISS
jgi:hypothetical protein